jgi:Tol biopolymer transport system component
VIGGDLWVTQGGTQFQLTQGSQISEPVLRDDAIAFVGRQRNASDIWLASADAPLRPVTQNTSPVIAQNHWASQPVFVPGRQRLYVVGDFNKSSTGPGNLAVWELSLQEHSVAQITRPPEYAGGDQDITLNPEDPRQIIFTRYSYSGTRLAEQLQWMDVSTNTPVALTQADLPSRQASYSPDGSYVAFIQAGQGTAQDLWIARLQVTSGGAQLEDARRVATGVMANPVWSPDGNELAYIALVKDQFQVWSVAVRQTSGGVIDSFGQPAQVTAGPGVDPTSRPVYMTREQAARVRDWLTMPSAHS